jgi:hypothetical protein
MSLWVKFTAAFLITITVFVFPSKLLSQSQSRPVYVVAHRCNTGSWATNAVQKHGVNAIEADFIYSSKDNAWFVAHDNLLTNPAKLDDWLAEVSKEASRTNTPLSLLHVDIKTPEGKLGQLFTKIRSKLPNLYLIFDIGLVQYGTYLTTPNIKDRILQDNRAVAAMGFDNSPTEVKAFFESNGYPRNKYWYEIGIAAGGSWSEEEQTWTREAIKQRDSGQGPKVVIWSFENENTVKYWLGQGVDAILVNSSECFGRAGDSANADVHVKNAKKLTNAVYGTPEMNPFAVAETRKPQKKNYSVSVKTGDKSGAGTDSNIYMTLVGEFGTTQETQINSLISGNAFERNQTDNFTLRGFPDVGFLQKVIIRSDDKYPASAWYLDTITVNSRTARFRKWVETGKLTVEADFK